MYSSIFTSEYRQLPNGTHLYGYDELDSTNLEARRFLDHASQDAHLDQGILFVAKRQVFGKGQFERTWESGLGGLYYTLLIRRPEFTPDIAREALTIGEVITTQVRKITTLPVILKAPNDLMLNGNKLGGILMEAFTYNSIPIIIVGLGLNINQTTFTPEITPIATSIKLATNKNWDIAPFIVHITTALQAHFSV